jgi:hypothetical protein
MFSATAIAAESAQNNPKQPNFAEIYPKTISLRNYEIPPKIEILMFFKKKSIHRGGTKACAHHLDFQYNNFYAFSIVNAFVSEFQHTPLWNFFSQCSTSLVDMRFCRHVPNPL